MKNKYYYLWGVLLFALAVTALLGGFAGAAFAANSPRNIADTYTMDGLTYYNVNSPNANSERKFYMDMISKQHSALGGHSLGDLWLMAGIGMLNNTRAREFVATLKPIVQNNDLSRDIQYPYLNDGDYILDYYAPKWVDLHNGYVEIWMQLYGGPSGRKSGKNLVLRVQFSDFSVGALLPADDGLYTSTITETGSVKNIEASSVKNATRETITSSQHVTRSVEESIENTVRHSSSYSFTEGLKIGAEVEVKFFGSGGKASTEIRAEFSQAFEDGWSKSQGRSKSKEVGSDVSVTLPPYTNVLIKQGDATTTTTTTYNCPVVLGYKVTIIVEYKEKTGNISRFPSYIFGSSNSNARKDLNQRAFVDGERALDPQAIGWEYMDNDIKDALRMITTHVPMSAFGAEATYTNKTTYSEVAGMAALYPLASVQLGQLNISFVDSNNVATMKAGNYSYTNYLTINGYNSYGAEYYGFDKRKGRWAVVDANMSEIAAADAPVVLEKESATGMTKFRAVKPGTCYLRYFIDENVYPTGIGSNTFTKNSDLAETAMLTITVLEDEVTYEIFGSYLGRVNSVPESLEGEGRLEVSVYDSTGKEIEGSYRWDKKQLKGITLTPEGLVSFTRPGKYHVRVTNESGTVYSNWAEITAEVLGDDYVEPEDTPTPRNGLASEGTTFVISGSFTGGVSADEESIEGAGKLQVSAFDSTGQEQGFAYSWEQKDGADGMTLDEAGNVSFTKTGSYYVRVRSGQVYSGWVEITANEKAPARFTHVPSAVMPYYDGTPKPLMNEDARYEGGVSVVYALGSDDITTPETYSSEIPAATEAGTYYVWCKIIGDARHDNSEPVCVMAAIEGASGDGNDSGNSGGSTNASSSSGGCDAGISALALGVLLLLRRKSH